MEFWRPQEILQCIFHLAIVELVFMVYSEMTSRIDNWIWDNFPILSIPDMDTQLPYE